MPSRNPSRSRDASAVDSSYTHQFHSSVLPSSHASYRINQASAVQVQRRAGHPRWAAMLSMGLVAGCLIWLLG
jgi:hypothetical protein